MDLGLKGRRALITGSTAGIGYAIARGLAAEGARVTITGRTQASVDAALTRLRKDLPQAVADGVAADCATAAGAERCSLASRRSTSSSTTSASTPACRSSTFRTPSGCATSRSTCSRACASPAAMHGRWRERGWGRILFVSSESGLNIPREMIHYGMSKTAQLSIARGLAMELAGTGVTVNALLPGPTRTENTDRLRAERATAAGKTVAEIETEFFQVYRPTSLVRRFTSAEEVANLAVYLCGEGASAPPARRCAPMAASSIRSCRGSGPSSLWMAAFF